MLSGYWGNKELDNLLTGGDQLMVALSADTMHEGWGKVKNWLTRWVFGDEVFTGSERGVGVILFGAVAGVKGWRRRPTSVSLCRAARRVGQSITSFEKKEK
jgi:hypothetical protein